MLSETFKKFASQFLFLIQKIESLEELLHLDIKKKSSKWSFFNELRKCLQQLICQICQL